MERIFASSHARIAGLTLLALGYMFRNSFTSMPNHDKIAIAISLISLIVIALNAHFSRRIPTICLIAMLLIAGLFLTLPLLFNI